MITQRWSTVGVLTLVAAVVFVPSITLAQHGPGRRGTGAVQPQHGTATHAEPAYDVTSEATFQGKVTDVKGGRSVMSRLLGVHTFGVGPKGTHEKRLLLKTSTETIEVRLAPSVFLAEQKVDVTKGDTVTVVGSRVMLRDSSVVLAREVRRDQSAWALRDSAGQPRWTSTPTEVRGFWTRKKVLLVVVGVKVALLATVLRH